MTTKLTEEELRILSEALTSESEGRKIGEVFVTFFESPGFQRKNLKAEGPEYSYISYLLALKGEKFPKSSALARNSATQIRSFIKRHDEFSDDLKEKLAVHAGECDEISNDEGQQRKEMSEAAKIIQREKHQNGIYAYTYPHYLNHYFISAKDGLTDDRTFIKIGRTSNALSSRLASEKTQMPQDPILLFFFKAGERERAEEPELKNTQNNILKETETTIHDHLKSIGHVKSSSGGGGTEWFLTNSATIESTAKLMKLDIVYDHKIEEAKRAEEEEKSGN